MFWWIILSVEYFLISYFFIHAYKKTFISFDEKRKIWDSIFCVVWAPELFVWHITLLFLRKNKYSIKTKRKFVKYRRFMPPNLYFWFPINVKESTAFSAFFLSFLDLSDFCREKGAKYIANIKMLNPFSLWANYVGQCLMRSSNTVKNYDLNECTLYKDKNIVFKYKVCFGFFSLIKIVGGEAEKVIYSSFIFTKRKAHFVLEDIMKQNLEDTWHENLFSKDYTQKLENWLGVKKDKEIQSEIKKNGKNAFLTYTIYGLYQSNFDSKEILSICNRIVLNIKSNSAEDRKETKELTEKLLILLKTSFPKFKIDFF